MGFLLIFGAFQSLVSMERTRRVFRDEIRNSSFRGPIYLFIGMLFTLVVWYCLDLFRGKKQPQH